MEQQFIYSGEKFADIQMLRYRLNGFEQLSLQQKKYIYCLAKATLCGRDITTDQFGRYNLRIRTLLESLYTLHKDHCHDADFEAMTVYLKRVWFSNGIYHHYGCEKFVPGFDEEWFKNLVAQSADALARRLHMQSGEEVLAWCQNLYPVIFDPTVLPKRVDTACGKDMVKSSACNYYVGVSQKEAEQYYAAKDAEQETCPPSYGLNSRLVKNDDGSLEEQVWHQGGMYGQVIDHIVYWLRKASEFAENEQQRKVIALLADYYRTGDLKTFDRYSIEWLAEQEGDIDFINGFIEVYGDPLGLKASWEGIVTYKDKVANERTRKICSNAQWFEDHSPVDSRFKKKEVRGVTANVVVAAMLGGDEYPSTAIGINLPNADWIRAQHGSKSITIGNLTEAYSKAAEGNGFLEEFVSDDETLALVHKYDNMCDDLHTDLHECLGHGSGQLLPGVASDALRSYASTIEEARADLFGLYYIADDKMVQLGLLPDADAYKAQYYTYMLNGLMTQLRRITPGNDIEEAHMRNRALIAYWTLDHAHGEVTMTKRDGKTIVEIHSYEGLRALFAQLLAEIQRIKSEGDHEAAKMLVERYAVKPDRALLEEVHRRYESLDIAPYKGFINPRLTLVTDNNGDVCDVKADYSESYTQQMLRYSSEFGYLVKGHVAADEEVAAKPACDVEETVKQIKRSFRLFMNGVASASMRDKGVCYKINWGIPVTRLREMAAEYTPSACLAEALWHSDVRECKLMATMLMPSLECSTDTAMQWLAQCGNHEAVEQVVFNLIQYMPDVHVLLARLLDADGHEDCATAYTLAVFHIVARLAAGKAGQGKAKLALNKEQAAAFAHKAADSLQGNDMVLKHAAMNSVLRYVDNGLPWGDMIADAMKKHGVDIF